MFGLLKKATKRKKPQKRIFHTDSMGGGYRGNSIKFNHAPKDISSGVLISVVGWKPHRPKKGDLLRSRLSSGNVSIGKFTKVELCRDPADMFFGDVKIIGYDLDYMKKKGISTAFTRGLENGTIETTITKLGMGENCH